MTVSTHNNTKGLVRAFDVRTGKLLWTFNTIPRPGEFGNDTWEENSWSYNGNTGVWTQISVDEELGLVYLPVETPTSDFYGGHRPGNNLFAESLVAVDLKTGVRKWHYQLVHHPIWNFDNCCAPILADVTIDGKPRKVVAQGSKQAWLYVFDRATGEPIWPIEERPVPQSDVPGEKTSPTQPHPTKPPPYARNYFRVPDDLIDFTPEMRQEALEVLKRYKYAPTPFNPPILGNVNGPLLGGDRPGHRDQLARHLATIRRTTSSSRRRATSRRRTRSLVETPKGFSDIRYMTGIGGRPFQEIFGPGDCCAADGGRKTRDDLPAAPAAPAAPCRAGKGRHRGRQRRAHRPGPADRQAAVRRAHGDQPGSRRDPLAGAARRHARQHPQSPGAQGPEHPEDRPDRHVGRGPDGHQDAGRDGGSAGHQPRQPARAARCCAPTTRRPAQQVGEVLMPAPQSGSPMTYSVDGRQYIIVAVSGGNYTGEYLAFALPQSEIRPTQQQ